MAILNMSVICPFSFQNHPSISKRYILSLESLLLFVFGFSTVSPTVSMNLQKRSGPQTQGPQRQASPPPTKTAAVPRQSASEALSKKRKRNRPAQKQQERREILSTQADEGLIGFGLPNEEFEAETKTVPTHEASEEASDEAANPKRRR